jgi:two-component system cell cycle response regulator
MSTKVLVVDDDDHIRDTLSRMVEALGFSCKTAGNGVEALEYLQSEPFDIVVTDIRMPRMDGMALLREVNQHLKGVDVIVMTAYNVDFSYTEVIEAGATDFISKPFPLDELKAKIKRILSERTLRSELIYLSIRDSLTGLFNRRYFYQKLQEESERAKRQKRDLALIIMDVDRFKPYNDRYGHLEGDKVLNSLGEILTSCIRQNVDTAYRFGGDEFVVLLIETDINQAQRVGERIRATFASQNVDQCSLSLGISQLTIDDECEDLIRRADQAMYKAKRAGGNRLEPADTN